VHFTNEKLLWIQSLYCVTPKHREPLLNKEEDEIRLQDFKNHLIISDKQIITPTPLQQLLTKQRARESPIIRKKIESVFESGLHIKFLLGTYFIKTSQGKCQ